MAIRRKDEKPVKVTETPIVPKGAPSRALPSAATPALIPKSNTTPSRSLPEIPSLPTLPAVTPPVMPIVPKSRALPERTLPVWQSQFSPSEAAVERGKDLPDIDFAKLGEVVVDRTQAGAIGGVASLADMTKPLLYLAMDPQREPTKTEVYFDRVVDKEGIYKKYSDWVDTKTEPLHDKVQEYRKSSEGLEGIYAAVGDLSETVGQMVPFITAGAVTGVGALEWAGLAGMSLSAGGSAYNAVLAENPDADLMKVSQYAFGMALLESFTETFVGGIPGLPKTQFGQKMLSKIPLPTGLRVGYEMARLSSAAKFATKLMKAPYVGAAMALMTSGFGEGFEEVANDFLEPFVARVTIDENASWPAIDEYIHSFAMGFAASLVLNVAYAPKQYAHNVQTKNKATINAVRTLNELNELLPTHMRLDPLSESTKLTPVELQEYGKQVLEKRADLVNEMADGVTEWIDLDLKEYDLYNERNEAVDNIRQAKQQLIERFGTEELTGRQRAQAKVELGIDMEALETARDEAEKSAELPPIQRLVDAVSRGVAERYYPEYVINSVKEAGIVAQLNRGETIWVDGSELSVEEFKRRVQEKNPDITDAEFEQVVAQAKSESRNNPEAEAFVKNVNSVFAPLGVEVALSYSLGSENAIALPNANLILLNGNRIHSEGVGAYVLTHELAHIAIGKNPQLMSEFKLAMRLLGFDLKAEVNSRRSTYEAMEKEYADRTGQTARETTDAQLEEEAVADFLSQILGRDAGNLTKLAATRPSAVQKLVQAVKETASFAKSDRAMMRYRRNALELLSAALNGEALPNFKGQPYNGARLSVENTLPALDNTSKPMSVTDVAEAIADSPAGWSVDVGLASEAIADLESKFSTDRRSRVIARGFTRSLITEGAIDFTGLTIDSPESLAVIAQIARDPRFETLRYVFLDAANEVVDTRAVSARMPAATTAIPFSNGQLDRFWFGRSLVRAQQRGATSFYLMHNHPSGNPQPSSADIDTTRNIHNLIKPIELAGHVVINSNSYAFITPDGDVSEHTLYNLGEDKLLIPDTPHELLGEPLHSPDTAADIAKRISLPDGYSYVFLVSRGKVRGIKQIPNHRFQDLEWMRNRVREDAVDFGAQFAVLMSDDPSVIATGFLLMRENYFSDVYDVDAQMSIFTQAGPISQGKAFGLDVAERVREFSVDRPVEFVGGLMAVHNLSEADVKNVLELGGMPMPSIAVVDAEQGHDNFGSVSFVFGSDTIDPQKSRYNRIYSADAWTPVFPGIAFKISEEVQQAAWSRVREILQGDRTFPDIALYHTSLTDSANRFDGNLVEAFAYEPITLLAYAVESGLEVDGSGNRYDLEERLRSDFSDDPGYKLWLAELFEGIIEKTGIRNQRDPFTPMGNRRSFEALHYEVNLENIVRAMREQNQKGDSMFPSEKAIAGAVSKQYGSLAEVRADAHRLQTLTKEELDAQWAKHSDTLFSLIERITAGSTESNQFILADMGGSAILEAARHGALTPAEIQTDFQKYSAFTIDKKLATDISKFLKALQNIQTSLFEAKPARAVGIEEIRQAVVPADAAATIAALEGAGVHVRTYDPSIEGSRAEVLNALDDLKFSLDPTIFIDDLPFAVQGKVVDLVVTQLRAQDVDVDDIVEEDIRGSRLHDVADEAIAPMSAADFYKQVQEWLDQEIQPKPALESRALDPDRALAPVMYSQVEKVIADKMPNNINVPDLWNVLNKQTKKDEIKWLGLEEFLSGENKISKEDLLNFIRASQLEVTESTLGGEQLTAADRVILDNLNEALLERGHTLHKSSNVGTNVLLMKDALERVTSKSRLNIENQLRSLFGKEQGPWQELMLDYYKRAGFRSENVEEFLDRFVEDGVLSEKGKQSTLRALAKDLEVLDWMAEQTDYLDELYERVKDTPFTDYLTPFPVRDNPKMFVFQLPTGPMFKWHTGDREGVLAHARTFDTVDAEGRKILFVQEIQSDWHQSGREHGYEGELPSGSVIEVNPESQKVTLLRKNKELESSSFYTGPDATDPADLVTLQYLLNTRGQVPDAPFRNNWHEFTLKRLLRIAAQGGYAGIAFANGQQNIDVYPGLEKMNDRIWVSPNPNLPGTYRVSGYSTWDSESHMIHYHATENEVMKFLGVDEMPVIEPEGRLFDHVHRLTGGEGMKHFYDKIVPSYLNKYLKQWGVRLEQADIGGDAYRGSMQNTAYLTPEMIESVLYEGQPMFSLDPSIYIEQLPSAVQEKVVDLIVKQTRAQGVEVDDAIIGDIRSSRLHDVVDEAIAPMSDKTFYKRVQKWLDQEGQGTPRFSVDSTGSPLAPATAEYFKDSKVRDEKGNLLVVYHGTTATDARAKGAFTVFRPDSHFGVSTDQANKRAKLYPWNMSMARVYPVYLDIKNPMRMQDWNDWYPAIDEAKAKGHDGIVYLNRFEGVRLKGESEIALYEDIEEKLIELAAAKGIDLLDAKDVLHVSLEFQNQLTDAEFLEHFDSADSYIAFEPNQIKSIFNTNPTVDYDIRFSKDTKTAALTPEYLDTLYEYYSVGPTSRHQDYAKRYVAFISPDEFLSLTATETAKGVIEQEVSDHFDVFDPTLVHDGVGPMLIFNKETGEVLGHEGRHRMALLAREGVAKVPILLDAYPFEEGKYKRQKLTEIVLTGQRHPGRPVIESRVTISEALPLSRTYKQEVYDTFGVDADIRFSVDSAGERVAPAVEKFFKDTAVVDADGHLKRVYHGTMTEFFQFTKQSARPDADWGRGYYFTDTEADMWANYATPDGPDLTMKIDEYVDMLVDSAELSDLSYEELRQMAAEEFGRGRDPIAIEAYLNIQNPLVIGGDHPTFWNPDQVRDFVETAKEVATDYEAPDYLLERLDGLLEEESTLAFQVILGARDALSSVVDTVQETFFEAANEIARSAIELMGYDGIIDHTVSWKFRTMDGVSKDTTHYVVFNSNQAKLTTNTKPTESPDIRFSTNKSTDQILQDWATARKQYGAYGPGMEPRVDERTNQVPVQTEDGNRVSQLHRTIHESPNTPESMLDTQKLSVISGKGVYVPITDASAQARARKTMDSLGLAGAYAQWRGVVESGRIPTKYDIVLGESLLVEFAELGDVKTWEHIVADLTSLATMAGQAVQAFSLLKQLSPEGRVFKVEAYIEKLQAEMEAARGRKVPPLVVDPSLLEALRRATTVDEMQAIEHKIIADVARQIPPTLSDRVRAWRYLCMLGNTRTHVRNIASNALMYAARSMKDVIGGTLEDTLSQTAFPGMERTKTTRTVDPALQQWAKTDFHTVENIIAGGGKFGYDTMLRQNMRNFNNELLNTIATVNTNLLEVEDIKLFMLPAYAHALANNLTANNITLADLQTAANPNIEQTKAQLERGKRVNEVLAKAREYAVLEAQKATYRDFTQVAASLNELEQKGGAVTKLLIGGLVPFKKTPINILRRSVEYSPAGLLNAITLEAAKLKKGDINAATFIDRLASGLTGTAAFIVGMLLARMGMLQPGFDDEEKKYSSYARDLGQQDYSVKVGPISYSIEWMSPAGFPMLAGAQFMTRLAKGGTEELLSLNAVGEFASAMTSMVDPLTELTLLQGISSALQNYDDDRIGAFVTGAAKSYAGQFVPTAGGQIARVVDPVRRDTYAPKDAVGGKTVRQTLNQMLGKVPGAAATLEPYVDVWGREQEYPTLPANLFEQFVDPGRFKKDKATAVDDEIARVFAQNKNSAVVPVKPQSYLTINGEEVYLRPKEYTAFKERAGNTAYTVLADIFQTEGYRNLDGEAKEKIISRVYEYSRGVAREEYAANTGQEVNVPASVAKVEAAEQRGVDPATYFVVMQAIGDLESDKDPKTGKTVTRDKRGLLTRKTKMYREMQSMGLDRRTMNFFIEAQGLKPR